MSFLLFTFSHYIPFVQQLVAPVKGIHGPPPTTCGGAPLTCIKSRYRSFDGSCNNLQRPALGVASSR